MEPVTAEQAMQRRRLTAILVQAAAAIRRSWIFGGCVSYALAREKRSLILWKGDDFAKTDFRPASASSL